MISFNKPFIIGNELEYIRWAVESGKISGDGKFTRLCQEFFENKYGFKKVLLTTSCTDALEMAAILSDIQPGDEVIMPTFTFVSMANAFVLRGAKVIFCDIDKLTLNISTDSIEPLINAKTKALVIVHYAGVACDMAEIMKIVKKHNLLLIEDAALSIDSYYMGKALGSFGHFATFSFHETKNIIAGEGGALVINDEKYIERAEIIREKGTNRSKFFRGEVDKYNWVDIGSSFLPSEIIAAFLYGQLEQIDKIQNKRIKVWNRYNTMLRKLNDKGLLCTPFVPAYAHKNGQLFHILCRNPEERTRLIAFLMEKKIKAVFHYLPLHKSPYYAEKHPGISLPVSESTSEILLRLPLYYDLTESDQEYIIKSIYEFYNFP